MTQPLVSIITINYNGWQDTCQLIDSLQQYETYPYEVIVVDNASQGDDVGRIRAAHPEVTVIASDHNRGFAGGNNLGSKEARGEYLFFLNNDTLVRTPIFHTLVKRLEASPANGGISPMIKYYAGEQPIQYAGFTPFTPITLRNHALAYKQTDDGTTWHTATPTPYLHGAAMMIPRKVVEQVGLMFQGYFLFYEEFDYSMTIRRAHYELWYEPAAVVYHKGEQSITPSSPSREYYLTRSRMIYARRNCQGWRRPISCLYQLLIAAPYKSTLYLCNGKCKLSAAVLQGAIAGLFTKAITP
jgi:GT2 family glycosyltransferase